MTGFEAPLIASLSTLVLNTLKETATKESGGTIAKWLNKDIGKAAEQAIYWASGRYIAKYRERHGTLKVVCLRMDTPIQIEDVYTAVRLLDRDSIWQFDSAEGSAELFRESGRRGFRGGRAFEQKLNGLDVANDKQFLMVRGGPGMGKSTFLRKVGLEALRPKAVDHTGYPQSQYTHHCIPVFLPLQRFKSTDKTIEQRIAEEFETCGFPEPEAFTYAMLNKGKLLVLLDGLDEVPADQESAVITQIQDFVDRYSNNRFVVSCRETAYKGGFPRFTDLTMLPFEDEQIEQFICNWFRSPKDQEDEKARNCWELMCRPEYEAVKELAQAPLLLTLLCAVYNKLQDFPKNRASLYGEALDVVLKEWAAEKRVHNNPIYRDLPLELEREMLAEIAYDSFVEDQLFFDKRDVTRRIKEFLVSNLNAPKHLDSEQILNAITTQQGILVKRGSDVYSFSYLAFQEYLTAQHIIDSQQIDWLISQHSSNKRWQEIFQLVAGLMRKRNETDSLLKSLENQKQEFVNTPKLKALLNWAVQAVDSSEENYKTVAKRSGAIAVCLDVYTRALARALSKDRTHIRPRVISRCLKLAQRFNLHLEIPVPKDEDLSVSFDFDLDLALTYDQSFEFELSLLNQVNNQRIFRQLNYKKLFRTFQSIRTQFPSNAQPAQRRALAEIICRTWYLALNFDFRLAKLSDNEVKNLELYLYIDNLLIQCKEAAVRVSPEVWKGIEARMLTVPQQ